MPSATSDTARPPAAGDAGPALLPVKVVVAGGFGVGKTTLVGTVSEIAPLRTEAAMTALSVGVDDTSQVSGKTTTTVALDFGRARLNDRLVLYIFGTPGQDRFWFMWDDLVEGAVGAIVLVDTRRLADSFGPLEYFEKKGSPFVVAVNEFAGAHDYSDEELREALGLGADVPLLRGDVRDRASAKAMLVELAQHALRRRRAVPAP
ncbi:GTP-binding protein [Kineococcus terrestris]|uniref:GTP-binding protein n=1 Tax=Kineococcus terrestris TaxID=2044856 RepID=UPI0034DAEED9